MNKEGYKSRNVQSHYTQENQTMTEYSNQVFPNIKHKI